MSEIVEKLRPLVDSTIAGLAKTKFREDPIGGRRYSRATSIISSAYKRHGKILERAILERLTESSRFEVWREDKFKLSRASEAELVQSDQLVRQLKIRLPYGSEEQHVPLDVLVFDKESSKLGSYNIKRGNGAYDAGKRRQILGELLRVNMLLEDYGNQRGLAVASAEAKIVFYYGVRSIPAPLSICGDELDDHFGFSIRGAVEKVNDDFRSRLYQLIEDE